MTAGIVGLGLIGGSLAKAYRAHGARVLAFDTDGAVLSFAQLDGTVDAVLTKENLSECDIVLIAVRPGAAAAFLRKAAPYFGARAIVIDCCGVKRNVCETAFALAREYGFAFLGGHPMAGSHKASPLRRAPRLPGRSCELASVASRRVVGTTTWPSRPK